MQSDASMNEFADDSDGTLIPARHPRSSQSKSRSLSSVAGRPRAAFGSRMRLTGGAG